MFWNLTLRELYQEFVIAKRKAEEEHNRDMVLAWHTAVLMRKKEIPPITKLLARPRFKKQSRTEQMGIMNMLAAKVGGKPRRTRLIHVSHDG